MAIVTNAFTTYNATANREDLSNAIYNIDPFDTPIMSAVRRRNVKNRIFDWQTEFLPLVNLNNAQLEGFSLANSPAQPTIRVNNTTQISERDATVSGTQEESDAAGKGSEMAHQMALASKVLKSDMESIMCSRQPRSADTSSNYTTTPCMTESISHWIARAVDKQPPTPAAAVAGVNDRPANARNRRLRSGRYGSQIQSHRGHARPSDAAGVRQWREPLTMDRAPRGRSGRSARSSEDQRRKYW